MHVTGGIDPIRDIEIIMTELVLADLESVKKRREKIAKEIKHGDKAALAEAHVLDKVEPHLDSGQPAGTCKLFPEERAISKPWFLLTDKPAIVVANIKDTELAAADTNPFVLKVREYTRTHHACDTVVISAQIESDLNELTPDEAQEFLRELGVRESGVEALIHSTYRLLGLRTFFTFNEKEARAWTIAQGSRAQDAAGAIHSDIARGFIRAEIVGYEDLMRAGSYPAAKEKGLTRLEGKDYIMQEGDVVNFRFNV
jgi:GTP-binding protein YchF